MTDAEFWDEVLKRGVGVAARQEEGVMIFWPMVVSEETGHAAVKYKVTQSCMYVTHREAINGEVR